MPSSYKIKKQTESAQPAVSVCDLKGQISLESADYDDLIEGYELAARDYIESITGRVLTDCSFTIWLDDFPNDYFYFTKGPVTSIDSIEYLVNGIWTAVDSSVYLLGEGDIMDQGIVTVQDQQWPTDKDSQTESVRVNFTAGAENRRALQAIKLMVAHWFANREAVIVGTSVTKLPYAVDAIIQNLRVPMVR